MFFWGRHTVTLLTFLVQSCSYLGISTCSSLTFLIASNSGSTPLWLCLAAASMDVCKCDLDVGDACLSLLKSGSESKEIHTLVVVTVPVRTGK